MTQEETCGTCTLPLSQCKCRENGTGMKGDNGKPQWGLLPWEEVEDIVKVLTLGSLKYSRDNWMRVPDLENRYFDALMRHLIAYRKGEQLDPESQLSHLSHAACCLLFIQWGEKQRKAKDNLPPKKEEPDTPKTSYYAIKRNNAFHKTAPLTLFHYESSQMEALQYAESYKEECDDVMTIDSNGDILWINPWYAPLGTEELRKELLEYINQSIYNMNNLFTREYLERRLKAMGYSILKIENPDTPIKKEESDSCSKTEECNPPKRLFYTIMIHDFPWRSSLDPEFMHMSSDSLKCAMELLEQEPRLSDGVVIIDSDRNGVYSNPRWIEMTYNDHSVNNKLINYIDTYIFKKDEV